MKAKLIKTGENFVLEIHKKDIPQSAKTVGQAGRHPEWVIIASSGADHPYLQLSLKNCQAIELGYDLDEEVSNIVKTIVPDDRGKDIWYGTSMAVGKLCFQKALEILGDKKFSEDDVKKAYTTGWNSCNNFTGYDENQKFIELPDCIQSLQQTEWDVIIKMRPASLVYISNLVIEELDADGCLILKRK